MKRRDSLKGIAGLFGLILSKPEPEAPPAAPAAPTPSYRVAEAARRIRVSNGDLIVTSESSAMFVPIDIRRGRK